MCSFVQSQYSIAKQVDKEMETLDSTNPDIDEPPPSYPGSIGYHESVMNETELYISQSPPSYPGITILDTGSGSPPPYPGGTAHQPSVVTELQPSRNQSSPSHPAGSSRAISQPNRVLPRTTVTTNTSQTSREDFKLCLCYTLCFLCGCPLTLFCTLPAILLCMKVYIYLHVYVNLLRYFYICTNTGTSIFIQWRNY